MKHKRFCCLFLGVLLLAGAFHFTTEASSINELKEEQKKAQEEAEKTESAKITSVDISSMRRYFKNNGISEEKVLKAYKVKKAEELSFGQFRAILADKNREYFIQNCGV